MELKHFASVFCALFSTVAATTSFVQPPPSGPDANYQDNPRYKVGQQIGVQWTSNLTTMDLFIFQQYPIPKKGVQFFKKLKDNERSTSMLWTVSLDGLSSNVPKGQDVILYFAVLPNKSPNVDGRSHYFNVTVDDTAPASTTASASSTVATMSMTASEAVEAPTGSTSPSASSVANGTDSGLSGGAVAGIAVGCTLGGILVLGGIGLLLWKKHRGNSVEAEESRVDKPKAEELAGPTIYEAPGGRPHQHQQTAEPIYEAP